MELFEDKYYVYVDSVGSEATLVRWNVILCDGGCQSVQKNLCTDFHPYSSTK